jgi:hypothetical protein
MLSAAAVALLDDGDAVAVEAALPTEVPPRRHREVDQADRLAGRSPRRAGDAGGRDGQARR